MEIQLYQLIQIAIYLALAIVLWKNKNTYVKLSCAVLIIIVFALNPFRFSQEGGAAIERSTNRFDDLPSKVIVPERNFGQSQSEEMKTLRQQSKELKDEIDN